MKQPKPMVGQTWRTKGGGGYQDTIKSIMSDGTAIWSDEEEDFSTIEQLDACWEFVPQNDLEWLAVHVGRWNGDKHREVIDSMLMRIGDKDWSYTSDGYTREQWQSERYRLGLDTKPHYKLINGQWSETK